MDQSSVSGLVKLQQSAKQQAVASFTSVCLVCLIKSYLAYCDNHNSTIVLSVVPLKK